MSQARIVIAEDNSFALQVILGKLRDFDSIVVCSTVGNGEALLARIPDLGRVDLVLMDIEMPKMDGIEATRTLKAQFPQIKVLMLTIFDDDERILEAIMAGADGYLLKDENAERIALAIRETLEGGAGMSAGIAARVLKLMKSVAPVSVEALPEKLTQREIEILGQLKTGMSYEQIGDSLFISYGTVRKHIENVYRKLQVHNKVEAIQKAQHFRL